MNGGAAGCLLQTRFHFLVCAYSFHFSTSASSDIYLALLLHAVPRRPAFGMCARVCVQIEWPVIRGLNGVCCLNPLLIKLDWLGLLGTCHNQASSHSSPTDLAAASPPWTSQRPEGVSATPHPGTDHRHYPLDPEPLWPTEAMPAL